MRFRSALLSFPLTTPRVVDSRDGTSIHAIVFKLHTGSLRDAQEILAILKGKGVQVRLYEVEDEY